MHRLGMVMLMGMVAAGCGGSDAKASSKCTTLVSAYCSRVVSCAVKGNALSTDFTQQDLSDECHQVLLESAQCEDAVTVTSSYDACVSDAKTLDCDESNSSLIEDMTFALPQSCNKVILYQK